MPMLFQERQRLLEHLPTPSLDGIIYELGSGWGTLAFPIAKKFNECQIVGYEISPIPWIISKLLFIQKNLKFVRKDFFTASLKDATLVVCYLYPGGMIRLKEKFTKELRPGTKIVSYVFSIPGWQPETVIEVRDLYRSKIFIYLIK